MRNPSRPPRSAGKKRGYDAGKKVKGRKRHIVVDSMGLLLAVHVTGAELHDSAGACALFEKMDEETFPRLEEFVCDAAYRGERVETAAFVAGQWEVRIVTRRDDQKGFEVQPIRWIVERTFAWLSRCRRLAHLYPFTSQTNFFRPSSPRNSASLSTSISENGCSADLLS